MENLAYVPVDRQAWHDGDPMADKAATRLIAKGLPTRDGKGQFFAQFAAPGLVPALVMAGAKPVRYNTEGEAEDGARLALFGVLQSRMFDKRKAGGYGRLRPAEFATALDDAEITPTYFAEIYGVPQARVMMWLDGQADIPHSAHVLVKLLAVGENFQMARSITEKAQEDGQ